MNHPILKNFTKVLETDFANFYLNEKGDTLISRFKESTEINHEVAKETLECVIPFKEGGSTYAITDFSARFITVTNDGKKYFKENLSPKNTFLVAVIVGDVILKHIANAYARFDKPTVHTRVFTDILEASEWIEDLKS